MVSFPSGFPTFICIFHLPMRATCPSISSSCVEAPEFYLINGTNCEAGLYENGGWWDIFCDIVVISSASFALTSVLNSVASQYEGVSKSFRTGRLERELHMVRLSATRCSCSAILWVSLVSFAAISLCVASQAYISLSTQSGKFWIHPRTFWSVGRK
jgi:hypothetical protein